MTQEQLRAALGELLGDSIASSDNQHNIPAGVNATLFASFAQETLTIARVTRVILNGELVIVETARSERYVIECSRVCGVKADLSGEHTEERSAGFGRK